MHKPLSKAKRGPALFDLLGANDLRRSSGSKPAAWMDAPEPAAIPAPEAVIETAPAAERPLTYHPPETEAGERAPILELDGDRVRISLTSVPAAVVLFAILVVLFGMYELGRRSGERSGFKAGHATALAGASPVSSDPANPIEAARSQPPATHLVGNLLSEPAISKSVATAPPKAARPAPADGVWTPGLTHVVVQEFVAGRDADAQRAQEFLGQHGIEADIVKLATGSILLLTRQGFNHKDAGQKQQSEQILQKVRSVGAKYFAAGGGYRLEGYHRTRKSDGW